jgi:tRNA-modifying protein YgfZ
LPDPSTVPALSSGAVVVPRADRGVIRVAGADRATWLQGLLTNDIEAVGLGRGTYAAWLTPQGRMITDAVVLAEDDAITLEVPAAIGEDLYRRLDAAVFAEDVLLTDECGVWIALGVHGALAADVVSRAMTSAGDAGTRLDSAALTGWPEYANAALAAAGRLYRRDVYGTPGYVLRVARADAEVWTSRLRLAGATPALPADLEFARIEAGQPEFLVDMDEETIPLEAGIEGRAISFTKGCYVGQEVIVRVVHRGGGRVARRLVGLRFEGDCVPSARAAIRHDTREIGYVTSAAPSPRLGRSVALGYVRREFVEPGSTVAVDCGGTVATAIVSALPIA